MAEFLNNKKEQFHRIYNELRKNVDNKVKEIKLEDLDDLQNLPTLLQEPFVIRGNLNEPNYQHLKVTKFEQLIKHPSSSQQVKARKINKSTCEFEYVIKPMKEVLNKMVKSDEYIYQIVEKCYPRKMSLQLDYEPSVLKSINWWAERNDAQTLVICSGDIFTKLHYDAGSASFQMITDGQKQYIYVPFELARDHFDKESKNKQKGLITSIPDSVFKQAKYVELNMGDINYLPPGYGYTVYSPSPAVMISTEMINLFTYPMQQYINKYNFQKTRRYSQLNMPGIFYSERCKNMSSMIEFVSNRVNGHEYQLMNEYLKIVAKDLLKWLNRLSSAIFIRTKIYQPENEWTTKGQKQLKLEFQLKLVQLYKQANRTNEHQVHYGQWRVNGQIVQINLTDRQLLDIFTILDSQQYKCNETSITHGNKINANYSKPKGILKHLKTHHFAQISG